MPDGNATHGLSGKLSVQAVGVAVAAEETHGEEVEQTAVVRFSVVYQFEWGGEGTMYCDQ